MSNTQFPVRSCYSETGGDARGRVPTYWSVSITTMSACQIVPVKGNDGSNSLPPLIHAYSHNVLYTPTTQGMFPMKTSIGITSKTTHTLLTASVFLHVQRSGSYGVRVQPLSLLLQWIEKLCIQLVYVWNPLSVHSDHVHKLSVDLGPVRK